MYASDRIAHALDLVRLPGEALDKLPGQLSGGMRKRVGVARAVINMPDIMLYDEPTTGLDPGNVSAINELIVRSRDALGATAMVVTHDMASLPVIADRVAFLTDGSIRFDGSPADFAASPDPLVGAFLLGHAGNVDPLRPPVWNRG
jgi:phospholipid/cholesterol/gamma-HCH transport system ATP-binding protein